MTLSKSSPVMSFRIKKADELRILEIAFQSNEINRARESTVMELDFLFKTHLANFGITNLHELIISISGITPGAYFRGIKIVHHKTSDSIKTFIIYTSLNVVIQTFDLNVSDKVVNPVKRKTIKRNMMQRRVLYYITSNTEPQG